ncbi:porin family protein [Cytophaga hutchinsonii]|uniref:Outer membrane protein beta-barrel domain-containing protein n=1 Tax=Cytophaga hutchinsonii (strain ATCC 33406 / DSM 1761 / CIP 103989 / NBRC 15051 / NCIMB 9469 / D465) TaxID=269798 RepID=A0A6N4SWZ1_CYTH3|nr:porin family protein [Cytophaga hutchinsonii]ABG60923.1 hypothetical protein CHU_3690 [Cytophaga hutchinsonii ATCC 33406]SFX42560.1 Outer membrane protein beta-barrel domain-containing protein [Cytophaga hutchinsonii ATCC 33406]
MKKISLLFLSCFLAVAGFSQVTLGLRLSPALSLNRVKDLNSADGVEFSNNSSGVRFAFGPTVDFHFGENYAFSTGAWYLSSRAGLSQSVPGLTYKEIVSLQSVQIPVTFKAYTNEIATNMKLYFQLGGLATFNFYEKFKESTPSNSSYDDKYNVFDVSLYVGAGVSYKIGESNALFGGFYYSRGLMNMLDGSTIPGTSDRYKKAAKYNNDLVGLEVGITF